ncbi:histidinol phosphatase [Pleurocapsales cyanobacterium LEGE 06147]|nr:histidinol phosphatase [Pleurocapsales cyanobacterium LEGE 06147]
MAALSVPLISGNKIDITEAIDFHVHSAPDITPRSVDDFQLAKMAADAGMKAVVLKNHVTLTSDRALLANTIVPGIELFGGIVLNYPVGGLNPRAVEIMYRLGKGKGKVVWLPTVDADYHHQVFHVPGKGIRVAKEGNLLPEVEEILQLIAKHNLVLGTGHLSPEEIELVVDKAKTLGIDNILITHAMADVPGLSLAQMKKLASLGAFLELTYVNDLMGSHSAIKAHQNWHRVSLKQMARAIKIIGAQHFVLSTDLGRSLDPLPADGYLQFVRGLIDEGISQTEIDMMSKQNPAQLLGLN